MDNAFNFIEFNGGVCTEDDYPYVSGTHSLAFSDFHGHRPAVLMNQHV
jgi:hypothetical protein